MNNYYVIAIILLFIIIFMLYMSSITVQVIRPNIRPNVRPTKKLIGGCKGTRWGCCPDGVTTKIDRSGNNCS